MKLRNKKTGEIREIKEILIDGMFNVNSLTELNDEWEDYEESKYVYFINAVGGVDVNSYVDDKTRESFSMRLKQIDNYFETKAEAERAVEKLKAWKKLKDNGFRFIDWELDMKTVADGKIWFDVGTNTVWDAEELLKLKPEVKESLDLLFGGEE